MSSSSLVNRVILVVSKYGNSSNTVSRRRSDRQDLRLSGRAAALALSQALRTSPDSGAFAHARTQPARHSPAEVHALRDRLAHRAKTTQRPRPARRLVLRHATVAARLLLLPG